MSGQFCCIKSFNTHIDWCVNCQETAFCRFTSQAAMYLMPPSMDSAALLFIYNAPLTIKRQLYINFLKAGQKYNLPSRVCSDQGLENVTFAKYMIENGDAERHSILTGSSTHNQCIKHLWRDMHKCVSN